MAAKRHASASINQNVFICVLVSLLLPTAYEGATRMYDDGAGDGRRLTREYHLRQGALRGLIVRPSRNYDLQNVEMFLGIPYAAAPVGNLRFMPPVTAPPWPGLKMATHFAPVCPQMLPPIKKGNPPSLGRQQYLNRLKPFLSHESEDCLYLNIYVPYREQKSKKFPILVFIHGDSFEWSSGNPYDGRVLAAYGNIMVITINFRLGILGFLKPSLTEHDYGNNGLLDQLAALQWIKDNIEDLNGDPNSVTLMGHGTGAACVSFLMLSPISNGFFHRAILMSGSALSDWAMTKDPTQYTLQVVQSLGCNPNTKNMLSCLQNKTLSDIKKVQILSREFETPLGPIVAGAFVPNEPANTIDAFPNLLSKYQLLSGVTELERYHDFGVIELDHGILENQRDDFITKYAKVVFDGAENIALKEILKEYSPSSLDPQRWSVETNREVILTLMSDARTLAPQLVFADYHSKANGRSYFYVFGHNSISTEYAPLNKSVNGEELPYVLGVPLGGTDTHFHSEYTQKEKLLSEVVMRLWTNFVKIGTPNTQSVNEYYTLDKKQWSRYNVDWPEYNIAHQSFLRLDIPPHISSLYRSNYTRFWSETLPNKLRRYVSDPLFEIAPPAPSVARPRTTHRNAATTDHSKRLWQPQVKSPIRSNPTNPTNFGHVRPYSPQRIPDTEAIYRELQLIKTPSRPIPPGLLDKTNIPHLYSTTVKPKTSTSAPVKTSSATVTLIVSLGTLFLAVNVGICAVLYFKKRRLQLRERALETTRRSRAELGEVDVIGHKSSKEDKGALQTLKNGCSVIKSISFNRKRGSSQKSKKKSELCKTPKSDDSGGFRERFQLRRHLSTSTLDAHTKVRDWITNEVMHRCSPGILRKSNSEINNDKHMNVVKPFTRSEELLSDSKKSKKDTLKVNDAVQSKGGASKSKTKTSEKTTSTSALGSHSSIASAKQSLNSIKHSGKSTDSLKSKGTDSIKSKKVSVAIDATPSARTNSILKQEPIEISKSFDGEAKHSIRAKLAKEIKEDKGLDVIETAPPLKHDSQTFTNVVTLSFGQEKPLKISHKHSTSDPVTDVNYDKLKQKTERQHTNILPPVTFRNDINVTSRDEAIQAQPLSAEEALLTIKRRNFPKVLPDLPRDQRRLSLQPNSLQTFRGEGTIDSPFDRPKLPPQPPPRTTTLERRLAYKNTKPLSSFDVANVKRIPEKDVFSRNYENISTLSHDTNKLNRSFETSISDKSFPLLSNEREYPRVIIASNDIPTKTEPKIVIKASSSHAEIPSNVPRVTLPEDFHSNTGSYTSFSSFYSDDDISEFPDDLAEDQLIQELVGGVDSPTNMDVLDSKGPETIFEKKLEIIPVKINPGSFVPKSAEDYICVSDLCLPDVSTLENTAKIKPNFGLNKLQRRSESIHKPPEKAIKVKNKRGIKSATILNRKSKSSDKCKGDDGNKLEHSNSGSSNDTETSTGTVREVNKNITN